MESASEATVLRADLQTSVMFSSDLEGDGACSTRNAATATTSAGLLQKVKLAPKSFAKSLPIRQPGFTKDRSVCHLVHESRPRDEARCAISVCSTANNSCYSQHRHEQRAVVKELKDLASRKGFGGRVAVHLEELGIE